MTKEDFRITLAAARVNAGMTQEDVANAMGVSKATILNWETGKFEIKPAQFKMYCDVVNVPEDIVSLPSVLPRI